jgi:prevent-host-death family protein
MHEVSVRDLRNDTAAIVARVRAGEALTLTVNRQPVADIVPHRETQDAWVSASEFREVVGEPAFLADDELLNDIADVRGQLLDD